MLSNLVKIEKKNLEFVFEIVNVQFNQPGHYRLILTVENPLLEGSGAGVQLRVNNKEIIQDSFCKNDRNHDVRLKVEAIRVTDSEVKAGEGFFAIYPRTNAPQIDLYAEPGEELYQYSGVMALLHVQNDYLATHYSMGSFEQQKIHRGTLDVQISQDTEYTLPSLWPQEPILNTEPDAKMGRSRQWSSSPRSITCTGQLTAKTDPDLRSLVLFPHELTPSQSPEPFPYIYVTESPLRTESVFLSPPCPAHVSQPGHKIISVTLYGATSLPLLTDGRVPLPFAIVGTEEARTGQWRNQAVTHCALQSTHNPCWEENLSVELVDVEGHREGKLFHF
ncbi:coiled-coil domain-containing protein 33-like [Hemibagrus wyckioides]|uniref:coiled-coil domain-containing protein 33-like n=1 Tax=Hemibagrus wyckioides TaxID=337641 RepID=UPI00266D03C4|nr:coiled-coil domain-containing protein 33-like [Hemibagrus wyckioides]